MKVLPWDCKLMMKSLRRLVPFVDICLTDPFYGNDGPIDMAQTAGGAEETFEASSASPKLNQLVFRKKVTKLKLSIRERMTNCIEPGFAGG